MPAALRVNQTVAAAELGFDVFLMEEYLGGTSWEVTLYHPGPGERQAFASSRTPGLSVFKEDTNVAPNM